MTDTVEITETHSDDAYTWYNSPDMSKRDFERFAAHHGVVLFGDDRTYPEIDWADVAMSIYDATKHGDRK